MGKQTIFFYFILFFVSVTQAVSSDKKVFVAPSPEEAQMQEIEESNSDSLKDRGLDKGSQKFIAKKSNSFHLEPTDSLTLALGPAYEIDGETDWWLGIHYSPWMNALSRWQFGVDVHDKIGWLQTALHFFKSRNRHRLYAGPGLSLLYRSDDKMASFSEIENYFLFLAVGGETQIHTDHSLRLELSYHGGTETHFLRATLGYSYYF